MKKSTPLLSKKLLFPFILLTSLFALWGFANAVTDPMVQAFKKVLELSNTQAAWVQMAFYGGYFCMALPAALFIRKYSYKVGILIGLGLYASGALLFYPAAISEEFWFFCIGLYILTFGLAFLETAANPYALAMGPKETATQRLNLAQSFNPLGLILGLFVAQQYILKKLQSDDIINFNALDEISKNLVKTSDLIVIRDPYVILGLVIIIVFILFTVSKMPNSKDDKLNENIGDIFKKLIINRNYISGIIAENINIDNVSAGYYQMVAFVFFFTGRAVGTYLLKYIKAGDLLKYYAILASIFTFGAIVFEGVVGLCLLVGVSFFMSINFPTIYGLSLSNLNSEESKIGSAGLIMAIVGGALMPKLQATIIDIGGYSVNDVRFFGIPEINFSFILPIFCFIYIARFGLKNN